MQIQTIKEKYNAEIALIILCCRHFVQTTDSNAVQLFVRENSIDWQRLFQLSAVQRIIPIVYNTLSPFTDLIKPENLEKLRNSCLSFNLFALNNKRELNRILDLLKENNILAKPFKGIVFAEKFYGNIGMRFFSDNDIIILTSDIDNLISLMVKEGYRSPGITLYKRFPEVFLRDQKDFLFEKKNDSVREFAFEFHFKISYYIYGYPFTFQEILGTDYITQLDYDINQHLKLMTLSNGLADYYPDLRSILDLAVILKKSDDSATNNIDPVLSEYLNYGKEISIRLLGYPETPLKENLNYRATRFCNYLQENILARKGGKRMTVIKYMYIKLKNANSLKDTASQLKRFCIILLRPTSIDVAAIKLPYYFLYYFIRPFRILIKFFRRIPFSMYIF